MKYNAISGALMDAVPEVKLPVYFFAGKYDYTDPFECTEEYFRRIIAPRKKLVWFENSAHFAFLEEPERFAEEMRVVMEVTYLRP
jgi:pimeloyl-ACP methyl ester carboxylesterase